MNFNQISLVPMPIQLSLFDDQNRLVFEAIKREIKEAVSEQFKEPASARINID